ncbi:unnamed protein product [Ilex paraguariensis]|uniref:DUF3700 domain-containing protein n=1 Tax=Ilex paraguariensis TaxID=185542 RepID=A0ABC8ULB4_9AQUA
MLAVFEKGVANPPEELSLPAAGRPSLRARKEIAEIFQSWRRDSTLYGLSNGNFMALSHEGEFPLHPRSIVVKDDIFCIFTGSLNNTCELRRHYGLSRQVTEAMLVIEAYKVLRDRAPYPPDQVVKELEGKFAFILFDANAANLFLARDRDGFMQFHWGMAGDRSLVCSDDPKIIMEACGNCYAPFPPGCLFMNQNGLISFDHPLHKVRASVREDNEGKICSVIFQVDLYKRLHSIPRTGSAANWAGATVVEGE